MALLLGLLELLNAASMGPQPRAAEDKMLRGCFVSMTIRELQWGRSRELRKMQPARDRGRRDEHRFNGAAAESCGRLISVREG